MATKTTQLTAKQETAILETWAKADKIEVSELIEKGISMVTLRSLEKRGLGYILFHKRGGDTFNLTLEGKEIVEKWNKEDTSYPARAIVAVTPVTDAPPRLPKR